MPSVSATCALTDWKLSLRCSGWSLAPHAVSVAATARESRTAGMRAKVMRPGNLQPELRGRLSRSPGRDRRAGPSLLALLEDRAQPLDRLALLALEPALG